MNDIDTINPFALSDDENICPSNSLNTIMNVMGILFIASFLGYLALHII